MSPLKSLILPTLCLLTAGQLTFSQDTMYYDASRKLFSGQPGGVIFRTKKKTDSGWTGIYYYYLSTGKPQSIGNYSDVSCNHRNGEFHYYDTNGVLKRTCVYVDDKLNGQETYYYPDGRIQVTGAYKDNRSAGEWIGYYHSGKISGKATYTDGRQSSAEFFLEDGTPNQAVTIFMDDPSYPGGEDAFRKFLAKTLRYPSPAVNKGIEGRVVVQFKVTKEGKIVEMSISQSPNELLSTEALRALRKMPDWKPAMLGGVPIDAWRKQPVDFKL
ncbi:MAG TPA: TonB family protein [Puia sp.]|nr:TonB family protein [Puia sp.]